jgi:PTH1 family peptidyl-tRNA hydrolase
MKLIIGFGNPGNQYNFTRHNFGFLALDFYAKVNKLNWTDKPRWKAIIAEDKDHGFLLVKPQTFYNDQGQAIRAIMDFYKLKSQDILVLCDDFNLPFGTLRFRERGSAGGNNGLKSTIEHLSSENFPRLRLGTGNDALRKQIGDTNFVLSKFNETEHQELPKVLCEVTEFIAKY